MTTDFEVSAPQAMPPGSAGGRPLRAAVFGTGKIGKDIIRGCALNERVTLVAGAVTHPEKAGRDLGELSGIDPIGVRADLNIEAVLARSDVDVVFYCGMGDPAEVAEHLGAYVDHGKDAITLTGLVHPATALGVEGARRLHERAVAGRARAVGAGWNPGFVLDVLPVMWASACSRLDLLSAQRVAEMRDWGDGVHVECGIGRPPEEVKPSGSNRLDECVALIADGIGAHLDRIDVLDEPYVTAVRRQHGRRVVEAGRTAGFHKRAIGIHRGRPLIELEMYAIFAIDPAQDPVTEGARIRVDGDVTVETEARGNWMNDSYPVTAAKAINSAPLLRRLPPGLYRPDQLPAGV
jgi:2,4-diaminopentanoate dehydrogenase